MRKYLTYAMVADAILVVVEFIAPGSHFLLPLAGSHFSQMSLLLMTGYFGGEVHAASGAGPNESAAIQRSHEESRLLRDVVDSSPQ